MKKNSTKNMMLYHLKDIKVRIEQKSIHNMKLQFENKYASRSPERILCLYSVRLVISKIVFPIFPFFPLRRCKS